jgi:hypothetical protein
MVFARVRNWVSVRSVYQRFSSHAHIDLVFRQKEKQRAKEKKSRWMEWVQGRVWEGLLSEWQRQKQSALYEITSRENSIISTSDVWTWLASEAKASFPCCRRNRDFSLCVVGRFLKRSKYPGAHRRRQPELRRWGAASVLHLVCYWLAFCAHWHSCDIAASTNKSSAEVELQTSILVLFASAVLWFPRSLLFIIICGMRVGWQIKTPAFL